jgi:hypothetical protein
VGLTVGATAVFDIGAAGVGAIAGGATAVTDYFGNGVLGQKNDWGAIALDSTLNALTGGAFEFLPGVPGRLPQLFSRSFFTGAHMQNALAQSFVGTSAQGLVAGLVTLSAANSNQGSASAAAQAQSWAKGAGIGNSQGAFIGTYNFGPGVGTFNFGSGKWQRDIAL